MRWKQRTFAEGQMRYKRKFPILPFKINHETRWLEPCWILQVYGITMFLDVCFADWYCRKPEDGTWDITYKHYENYTATCTLCGYASYFNSRISLPDVCPKCGWEKEDRKDETSD